MLQVISVLLENKPGALLRVTGLLSARGYNIESLTVARTIDPEFSRMTIVVDVDPEIRGQVIKQMNKLINVISATEMTDDTGASREMVLLHIRPEHRERAAVLQEAEIFSARVVESSTEGFAFEVTGGIGELEEFIGVMQSYGEIEVTRSGAIAVSTEARKQRMQPPVPTRRTVHQEEFDGVPNA